MSFQFAFKTINGSKLEDFVENKLDISKIHIDSSDVLNLCGTKNINYGHKFKSKKLPEYIYLYLIMVYHYLFM
jgi:hypothetical protein